MASEDITLLGKRISQLNPIPQDWSEEQVVELITKGLIPLAKSNYDTFKTTLGFAFGYIPSWKNYSTKNNSSGGDNSIFIGKSTTIGDNSISLGDNNNGGNRIISLGFGNTNVDATVCNFATIGYSNLIYNKVSEIRKYNDNDELESLPTQSFIAGVANKSRHYNDIIIGYGNESLQAESVEQGEPFNDDGFCIAIGFKNLVGRNYDIAIGHKSRAVGGENIGLQHGDAEGYRNLAMFNSNVVGTCNIATCDTFTDIVLPLYNNVNQVNKYVTYNVLHNSNFYYRRSENSSGNYSCNRNIILDTSIKVESDTFQQNFIYDGNGINPQEYKKNFTSKLISNNVIFDNCNTSITADIDFIKNSLFNNNGFSIVSKGTIYNNAFEATSINITNSKHIFKNKIMNSYVNGTVGILASNLILNSSITLNDTDIDNQNNVFNYNVVLSNSVCTFDREKSFWDDSRGYTFGSNFIFGANAKDCYGCFAMSDVGLVIKNANYSFVFGDNYVEKATDTRIFGTDNNCFRAIDIAIFGRSNTLTSKNDSSNSDSCIVTDGLVVGLGNIICGDNVGRFGINGSRNTIVCDDCHCAYIYGDLNSLATINIVTLTGEQLRTKQQNRDLVGHFKVSDFDVGYKPNYASPTGDFSDYSGQYFSPYDDYYYYDNGIVAQYNPSDITDAGYPAPNYTTITASNFISNYINGNLTNKTYYKISSDAYVPDNVHLYEGVFLIPNVCYGYYKSHGSYYLSEVNETQYNGGDGSRLNSYITVYGNSNAVESNIVGYSVFGMSNKVTNTLVDITQSKWCISNGFIQGNNNEASNGSNIVIFGNGNKSIGHNSVTIGTQLLSKEWQTVIGKYNVGINGPSRIIERFDSSKTYELGNRVFNNDDGKYYEYISATSSHGAWDSTKWKEINPDSDKAIFIIGNGYSEKDNSYWQDEQYIHRSNAMVVYADGTIKARKFKSDEPIATLVKNQTTISDSNAVNHTLEVPNNQLSVIEIGNESTLTLHVNVEDGFAPNFLVEVTPTINSSITITATIGNGNVQTLIPSVNGGNSLEAGKTYQISCCGSCWVIAEFAVPN